MNGNIKILFVLVIAGITVCLGACAKKKSPETAYSRLLGKWKLSKIGSDDNVNGIIDEREKDLVPATYNYQMLFNNEGKGVTSSTFDGKKSPDLNFNWFIFNGDSLRIIYAGSDTLTYFLPNISTKELFLIRQGDITLEWLYFNKQ